MNLLNRLLDPHAAGLADVREAAREMRAAHAAAGLDSPPDPTPAETDAAILEALAECGPLSPRHLRVANPSGVLETSEAIERLATEGRIVAGWDGRWRLAE